MKEKVLLGKWSAIAVLELQRIRFTGWALTEGQHRPKAGKKKKTREAGLFFLVTTIPSKLSTAKLCRWIIFFEAGVFNSEDDLFKSENLQSTEEWSMF